MAYIADNNFTKREYDAARLLREDVKTVMFPASVHMFRHYGETFGTLTQRRTATAAEISGRAARLAREPVTTKLRKRRRTKAQLEKHAEQQRERYRTDHIYREERKKLAAIYHVDNYDRISARNPRRKSPGREARFYYRLKTLYGLDRASADELFQKYRERCAACGQPAPPGTRLHVDHCHTHGDVRGLLCRPCNQALGMLNDSPERVAQLFHYIHRWVRSQRIDVDSEP